jgi:hypothetical protein
MDSAAWHPNLRTLAMALLRLLRRRKQPNHLVYQYGREEQDLFACKTLDCPIFQDDKTALPRSAEPVLTVYSVHRFGIRWSQIQKFVWRKRRERALPSSEASNAANLNRNTTEDVHTHITCHSIPSPPCRQGTR